MIIYTRKIAHKLLILRLSFIIILVVCFFAVHNKISSLAFFLSVVFIGISIAVINNIIVFPNNFKIVKYYFFGLIKVKWQFEREDYLQLKSYGFDFGAKVELQDVDIPDRELGCLFSIFTPFVKSEIIRKEIRIEKLSSIKTVITGVNIKIDKSEYKILLGFLR
jgi:hypothetical protein